MRRDGHGLTTSRSCARPFWSSSDQFVLGHLCWDRSRLVRTACGSALSFPSQNAFSRFARIADEGVRAPNWRLLPWRLITAPPLNLFHWPVLRYNPPPMNCPRCQKEIPREASSCAACGFSFDDATQKLDSPKAPAGKSTQKQSFSSFDSIDDARFVPGTILAERYRIVGLLGKGGMGEVYRADDLKLGQPVALKFLPDRFLSDGAALARFHREVRVARQVSHQHVCRVYDIGEVDRRHFLSMEYIRGEELSSLLRRIGRLPADKATEIARQLCAGLAAAHNKGVLHRDLKPANVMIDENGSVRITDFGLAGLEEEIRSEEIRAGTPAYMSPEQLAGKELTTRSLSV